MLRKGVKEQLSVIPKCERKLHVRPLRPNFPPRLRSLPDAADYGSIGWPVLPSPVHGWVQHSASGSSGAAVKYLLPLGMEEWSHSTSIIQSERGLDYAATIEQMEKPTLCSDFNSPKFGDVGWILPLLAHTHCCLYIIHTFRCTPWSNIVAGHHVRAVCGPRGADIQSLFCCGLDAATEHGPGTA